MVPGAPKSKDISSGTLFFICTGTEVVDKQAGYGQFGPNVVDAESDIPALPD